MQRLYTMDKTAVQAMIKNPKLAMEFQLTGKLPSVEMSPATPLRNLIDKIPMRMRSSFKGIKLSPELGFNSAMQFHTLSQLHTWLGANQKIVRGKRMAYMSYRKAGFTKRLTIDVLIEHCAIAPFESELNVLPISIQKRPIT